VAAVVALALGATWWLERRGGHGIEVASLMPSGEPASRYSKVAGLVAHPDFALLADPEGERHARDIAFLSWSAAVADAAVAPLDPLAPAAVPPADLTPLAPYAETADAP
jgi:hypothetical protein